MRTAYPRPRVGLDAVTDAPIGVFDSGVGGLTVARAIIDQLPNESILYVGDTAHSPYGPKPLAEVREYALAVLDDLVAAGREAARDRLQHRVGGDVPRRPRALHDGARHPGRRGHPARGARRRPPDPHEADRRDRHRGHHHARSAYDDAFVADPATSRSFTPACPRFVEFVEAGVTDGAGAVRRRRRSTSHPLKAARRRHPACSAAPTTRCCRRRSAT